MKSKKRLGKTLEDISHLFLSDPVSASSSPPKNNPGLGSSPILRTWMSVSMVSEPPSAFFTGNLALALARAGRRVLAVETTEGCPLGAVLGSVRICPSLKDLLEQPGKQVTLEGPLGLKILSFRMDPDEMGGFVEEEREILCQILDREEMAVELILAHASLEEEARFHRLLPTAEGVVLTVAPRKETLKDAYQLCKFLIQTQPHLKIGLLDYYVRDDRERMDWIGQLTEAVRRFLGKSLEWFGGIPDDPFIGRSLSVRVPLLLLGQPSGAASGFAAVADRMYGEKVRPKNGSTQRRTFFQKLQATSNPTGAP